MANYPTSVSTNANLYIAVNGLQTTLAAPITNSVTTIPLTSTSGFPTTGLVTIENNEVVSYTGVSGSNLTGCTRGADGTTALAHSTGVTVGLTVVAAHHNLLKDEIIAIETALGINLANVFPATPTTGTGNVVLQTSPTLITPNLGTPSAIILTNGTGLPLTTGVLGILPNANTTATPNATASTIMSRDANINSRVNEMIENFSTTVTAAGTTTLTVASSPIQQFTGTTTQTAKLPDATTLVVGQYFTVLNRSTGVVTVTDNSNATVQALNAGAQTTFVLTNNGSAAGVWDASTSSGSGSVAQYATFVVGTASGTYTGSTTVVNLPFAYVQDGKTLNFYYNGQELTPAVDYTETSSTSITLTSAMVVGARIMARSNASSSTATAVTFYRENYIVGTPSGSYTGSLTVFNLTNTYTPGGTNLNVYLDGDLQTAGAGIDYLETSSSIVTFNNSLVAGEKVTFEFSQSVAPGGTVGSGTGGQLAVYPTTGSTVSGTNDPVGVASINSTFIGLGRNRLINGDMFVNQANPGVGVLSNNGLFFYNVDQWWGYGTAGAGAYTTTQATATPPTGFQNYLHVVVNTADASPAASSLYLLGQFLEGYNVRDFSFGTAGAKTLTLSFWVRSNVTGTFGGSLQSSAGTRSYPYSYTINVANTWEQKTVTMIGETSGAWSLTNTNWGAVEFDLGTGATFRGTAGAWANGNFVGVTGTQRIIASTSNTFDLTGVQLEIGSLASAFEYLPFQMQLALCQRYYEKSYQLGTAPATSTATNLGYQTGVVRGTNDVMTGILYFKVPKRTIPSVTLYTQAGTSGQWSWTNSTSTKTARVTTADVIDDYGFNLRQQVTGNDLFGEGHWIADARI